MFGTLIESRAVMPRRTGGSVASIIIHSFIITGGIVATAKDIVTSPPEPLTSVVVSYVRPPDPRPSDPRPSVPASHASVVAGTLRSTGGMPTGMIDGIVRR